jgi:3-dehydroquinate synthase
MSHIFFTQNIRQDFQEWLKEQNFSALCVLTDENTHLHCYPILAEALVQFPHFQYTIPSGEQAKILPTCSQIWEYWLSQHLDRKALIINLGGGVLGDMSGFCAATYKRGIRFVQVPTTLLAQVDASVGGKLGIDFQGFKNVIGSFQAPLAVWIDTVFLKTLPTRELQSGMAEILKHCLIADHTQWIKLVTILSSENTKIKLPTILSSEKMDWQEWVQHSVKIKESIVAQDMHEQHIRKLLNFGHTIGHAIETYFLTHTDTPLLHGEAIAWGMIAESWLSMRHTGLTEENFKEIRQTIQNYFPFLQILPALEQIALETIANLALQDKKNAHNTINCVLLQDIGKAIFDIPITSQEIVESLLACCQI